MHIRRLLTPPNTSLIAHPTRLSYRSSGTMAPLMTSSSCAPKLFMTHLARMLSLFKMNSHSTSKCRIHVCMRMAALSFPMQSQTLNTGSRIQSSRDLCPISTTTQQTVTDSRHTSTQMETICVAQKPTKSSWPIRQRIPTRLS